MERKESNEEEGEGRKNGGGRVESRRDEEKQSKGEGVPLCF